MNRVARGRLLRLSVDRVFMSNEKRQNVRIAHGNLFEGTKFTAKGTSPNLDDRAAQRNSSIKTSRCPDDAISANHRRFDHLACVKGYDQGNDRINRKVGELDLIACLEQYVVLFEFHEL
jgi:hypothetical protein